MSVFTTVTHEQLSAWLTNYSIGTLTAPEGIAAGIENTNYFVTTSRGRYVLTLFEKLKAAELPFYLNLMDHLAGQGVPSARPVRNRAGANSGELNGKPAALVSFLRGRDITAPGAGQCARCGVLLAGIHQAGGSYATSMDNPRGPQWWESVMPEIVPSSTRMASRCCARKCGSSHGSAARRCRVGRSMPISSATTCCGTTAASPG